MPERSNAALVIALAGVAGVTAIALAGCGDSTPAASTAVSTGASAGGAPLSSEVQDEPGDTTGSWSYSGASGPAKWATLSPDYATCDGTAQTPIDISAPPSSDQPAPDVAYVDGKAEVFNNGHSVEAVAAKGSTLTVGGATSSLEQMHFHAPSEHTINGKHSPAEVHFVNQSPDGTLTVIGAMVEVGPTANAAWAPFVNAASTKVDATSQVSMPWSSMLPATLSSVRYSGSLTTPPCTEGVNWLVLSTPLMLGRAQLDKLLATYDHNNRPIQPLNGREVVEAVAPSG